MESQKFITRIKDMAHDAKNDFDEAQAKFVEAVKINPADAIRWEGAKAVECQASHVTLLELTAKIEHDQAHDHHVDTLASELVALIQQRLDSELFSLKGSSGSTCAYSSAVEKDKQTTTIRLHMKLLQYADRFEIR